MVQMEFEQRLVLESNVGLTYFSRVVDLVIPCEEGVQQVELESVVDWRSC